MVTYISSVFSFSIMIGIGILFRFVYVDCAWLILLFSIACILFPLLYHDANCKSLEIKDFGLALIITFLNIFVVQTLFHPVDIHQGTYLFLCSTIGVVQYAASVRFKTLLD